MHVLWQFWREVVFRFVAFTDLPPNRRSALLVAGLVVVAVGFCVLIVVWFSQPVGQALLVNRGLGPGWECENIPKTIVCRRVADPTRAP